MKYYYFNVISLNYLKLRRYNHVMDPLTHLNMARSKRVWRFEMHVMWMHPVAFDNSIGLLSYTDFPSQGANLMVCTRSWHLPGNPKLVWHHARIINNRGCVDLSMNTLHQKYPLVLYGSEGSALSLPLSLLSSRITMLCHCWRTMTKYHFLLIFDGTKWPLCVDVPLNTYSFIHSYTDFMAVSGL